MAGKSKPKEKPLTERRVRELIREELGNAHEAGLSELARRLLEQGTRDTKDGKVSPAPPLDFGPYPDPFPPPCVPSIPPAVIAYGCGFPTYPTLYAAPMPARPQTYVTTTITWSPAKGAR